MTQSKRTRKSSSQTASPRVGWVFGLIFCISIVLTIFVLFMQRHWKMSGQRAILIVHNAVDEVRKPLTLAVIRSASNELTLISIPEEQSVNILTNEVSYGSDALVGYAQLESYTWSYVQYLIGLEYGVVIDGIVWSESAPQGMSLEEVKKLARKSLFRQVPTTLAYWDRFLWWQSVTRIPNYEVENASEMQRLLLENKALDFSQYRKQFLTKIQDPVIRNSGWSVAILNGSGVQGYASRVASALEMMGYEVRSVDTIEKTDRSAVVFAPQRDDIFAQEQWADQRLRDFFQPFENREDEEISRRRRSNVVIILGTDQIELWAE